MVYLPTPDHRTELMIIYGEAAADNSSIPFKSARDEGVLLNDALRKPPANSWHTRLPD
jgi:hypothetical protein